MKKIGVHSLVFALVFSILLPNINASVVQADDGTYYGYFEDAPEGEPGTDNQNYYMSRDGVEKMRVYCINHNAMAPWRDNYADAVDSNLTFEKILANQTDLEQAVQANIYGDDLEQNVRKILYYINQNTLTTLLSNKLMWRVTGSNITLLPEEVDLYDDILENTVAPDNFVVELFKPDPEYDGSILRQSLARGYVDDSILIYADGKLETTVSVDGDSASSTEELVLSSENNLTKNVVDTIAYEGLFKDEEYNIIATLYEVNGGVLGDEVKKVNTTFIPATEDGSTEATFEDVELEVGKTYVVFEEMESVNSFEFADGTKKHRAEHKDVNDKAQTVIIASTPAIDLDKVMTVKAKIYWKDSNDKEIEAPVMSASVELYKDEAATNIKIKLSNSNNWIAEFDDLKVYKNVNGDINNYTVKEVGESNNLIEIGDKEFEVVYFGNMEDGFVIVNKEIATLPKTGEKDNTVFYPVLILLLGLSLIFIKLFNNKWEIKDID